MTKTKMLSAKAADASFTHVENTSILLQYKYNIKYISNLVASCPYSGNNNFFQVSVPVAAVAPSTTLV